MFDWCSLNPNALTRAAKQVDQGIDAHQPSPTRALRHRVKDRGNRTRALFLPFQIRAGERQAQCAPQSPAGLDPRTSAAWQVASLPRAVVVVLFDPALRVTLS